MSVTNTGVPLRSSLPTTIFSSSPTERA